MTDAGMLLADVHALHRKVRRDRGASAFPLFLFGGLILLAPLCYVPAVPLPSEFAAYDAVRYPGPFPLFTGIVDLEYPGLVGWYWFLTIVVGFAATVWWYRHQALRVGVEARTTGYLVAAGAALTGFVLGMPILQTVAAETSLYSTPTVNLPTLVGAAVGAAVVLRWGLLALAWLQRSVLLGTVGLVFGGTALLVNLYDLVNLYYRLGWDPSRPQPRLLTLLELLLPATVLLAGGVLAALRGRTRTALL